jgi:hypothetical protein
MSSQDPFMIFDWYFTDTSQRDSARYHALRDKPAETNVLMQLKEADSIVHFALGSELPDNHPVAELWLETQTDLRATIYLAYGGFFRQALAVLRSWFEIALLGVYFSDHYGQYNEKYEQWRRDERNAPANISDLARALASRRDMVNVVEEATILNRLEPIYSFLSRQIHGRGLDIYDLQRGRDNVPRYLSRSFDIWYGKVLEVFGALCFLYRAFFTREIASYLVSTSEVDSAQRLSNSLSGTVPDFRNLMDDVITHIT